MDWKKKVILIYAFGGLACGLIAGIMSVNNAVEKDEKIEITAKDGAKLGMAAMKAAQKVVLK